MRSPATMRTRFGDRGYGLIELLVVAAILGILAATAIPSYLGQRNRATEAGEKADARSLAAQMETYYAGEHRYPAAGDLTWSGGPRTVEFGTTGEFVRLSGNNQARVLSSEDESTFCIEVRNVATSTTAVYESGDGGLQAMGPTAACPDTHDEIVLDFPPD
jgi:type IV pilus assembly protein PilA